MKQTPGSRGTLGSFMMPSKWHKGKRQANVKWVLKTNRQPGIFTNNSSQASNVAIIYAKPGLAQITSSYD